MKNHTIISAYCFLAALTENNNDLYNNVYVPICKRALSVYSNSGKEFGTHLDIKELILEIYGIDVPESIVCKLIRGTEASLSRRKKEEIKLRVLENGRSFQLEKWAFNDLDEKYTKSRREAIAIEEAFTAFIKSKRGYGEVIPSFTEFLNRHKTQLSTFFNGEAKQLSASEDETYYHHVEFLQYIERTSHSFYTIAQELYLGAIVAGFLESGFEFGPIKPTNETFFLDTPVILKALDLQQAEDTNPTLELIHLIKKTGGTPKVLSITVEEIQRVINSAIEFYNNKTPVTTINDACKRRNKDRAWLMTLNTNLTKNILEILKIETEIVENDFIISNEKSQDIPDLQELRRCKGNAAHDVYSYLYVRMLRKTPISIIQNAMVWFVTINQSLLEFNIHKRPVTTVPEIVMPHMLTSLLWLKDPSKLVNEVKKIGLKELMASTLIEEVASKELIHEYNNQLKKIVGIDNDSYTILLEAVAHYSANSIEKFIAASDNDPVKGREMALQIVQDERERKADIQLKIVDALNSEERERAEKQKFASDLKQIESLLNESNVTAAAEIQKLKEDLLRQQDIITKQGSKIEEQENKIDDQINKIKSLKNLIRKYRKRLLIGMICIAVSILSLYYKENLSLLVYSILASSSILGLIISFSSLILQWFNINISTIWRRK